MNDIFSTLGFKAADILLPKEGIDCEKWAVVACDQYTSQEEYWESLSEYVGDSPSTLRLIYPEVYLEKGDKNAIISSINANMNKYLKDGIFTEYKDMALWWPWILKPTPMQRTQRLSSEPQKEPSYPVFLQEKR